jgi:hypothetical protein
MASERPPEPKIPLRLGDPENFRLEKETVSSLQVSTDDDLGIDDLLREADAEPSLIKGPPPSQPPSKRPSSSEAINSKPLNQKPPTKPAPIQPKPKIDNGLWFWSGMGVLCLLWASACLAFIFGAQSGLVALEFNAFRTAILVALALFPTGMILASGYALRQAGKLVDQTKRSEEMVQSLVGPVAVAAVDTEGLVRLLKSQIHDSLSAIKLAKDEMAIMSQSMREDARLLHQAADIAHTRGQDLTASFTKERTALDSLSDKLGGQITNVLEAVDRQSRMVADASDLAQAQLREAEAALSTRALELSQTASEAQDTSRAICEDLDLQTLRLETAGAAVSDQIQTVAQTLGTQRAELVSTALSLRAEQEDFAAHLDGVRVQLTDALAITRTATLDLSESAANGIENLKFVLDGASSAFQDLMAHSDEERLLMQDRVSSTLEAISQQAAVVRQDLLSETQEMMTRLSLAASEAREATDQATQIAQERVDRLNESLFAAGLKADDIFESRLSAAKNLIENSSDLIVLAGQTSTLKLNESFVSAQATMAETQDMLATLTETANRLPQLAQERLYDIRKSVEDGIMAMNAAARQAAEETEALDKAFQDRVKRNYEMLQESVNLMGVLSGKPNANTALKSAPLPRPKPLTSLGLPKQNLPTPPLEPNPEPSPEAQNFTARPKLRLSPIDEEPSQSTGDKPEQIPVMPVVEVAKSAGAAPSKTDSWSWREVFSGINNEPISSQVQGSTHSEPLFDEDLQDDDLGSLELILKTRTPNNGSSQDLKNAAIFEGSENVNPASEIISPPHDPDFDQMDDSIMQALSELKVDLGVLLGKSRLEDITKVWLMDEAKGARALIRRNAPTIVRKLAKLISNDRMLDTQARRFVTNFERQVTVALIRRNPKESILELFQTDMGRAYLLFDSALIDLN